MTVLPYGELANGSIVIFVIADAAIMLYLLSKLMQAGGGGGVHPHQHKKFDTTEQRAKFQHLSPF